MPEEGTVFRIIGGKPLAAQANLWLEGPYNANTMSNALNSADLLPETQPYNRSPWFYFGPEQVEAGFFDSHPEVVDWILLQLRKGDPDNPPLAIVASRAALLKSDGSIVDLDGISNVMFSPFETGPYYLVATHRNHLSIMTSNIISYHSGPAAIDFTTNQSTAFGSNPMAELDAGVYGLYGGDGDANGSVTTFDFLNTWLPQNGQTGYLQGDFNMTADVTAFDFLNVWLSSNGQASQIPE